jgi:hypothetical protein
VGRAFDDCGIAYFNRIRSFRDVIPAAAGIHVGSMPPPKCRDEMRTWIPAAAGMTR